jgi:hypothetical protein
MVDPACDHKSDISDHQYFLQSPTVELAKIYSCSNMPRDFVFTKSDIISDPVFSAIAYH